MHTSLIKSFLVISFLLIFLPGLSDQAFASKTIKLKVGYVTYPGFKVNKHNKLVGKRTPIFTCSFDSLVSPKYVRYPTFDRLMQELSYNKIDAGIFLVPTAKRHKQAIYGGDQFHSMISIVSLKKPGEPNKSPAPDTLHIGTRVNSNLQNQIANIKFKSKQQTSDLKTLIKLLKMKRIDAIVEYDSLMHSSLKDSPTKTDLYVFKPLLEIPVGSYFSKRFSKSHPEFLKAWANKIRRCRTPASN